MITITLNKIRAHSPCKSGWEKLLRHLGKTQADDEEFPLSVVLDSNGLDDALWCCRCLPEYDREWRLFAVWCARKVQHLMTDQRSITAIDVAERYAIGDATDDELHAAWDAALAAARDVAHVARDVSWDVAWDAAGAAASCGLSSLSSRHRARAAVRDTAGAEPESEFRRIIS